MVINSRIIFADEPTTGALDGANSELVVMQLFARLARENSTTIVMVMHDPTVAAYADRQIIVRDGVIMDTSASRVVRGSADV